jgi:HEPN domain-containing protein
LKAVCIKEEIIFKRTHDISYLIDLLENEGIEVPDPVKNGRYLTQYAVETRYPGVYEPIEEDEFMEALKDAEAIFGWAMDITGYENFEEKNEGHEETDIHD